MASCHFKAIISIPNYRSGHTTLLSWQSYRRKLEEWTQEIVSSVSPTEGSWHQDVSRNEDKVTQSMQWSPQTLEGIQRLRVTLNLKLQLLTHMRDQRFQPKQHHDHSLQNLQMTCCTLAMFITVAQSVKMSCNSFPSPRQNHKSSGDQYWEASKVPSVEQPALYTIQRPRSPKQQLTRTPQVEYSAKRPSGAVQQSGIGLQTRYCRKARWVGLARRRLCK